jgi:ribosome-binding protein aMBF1 (putative translation factor)
MVETCIRCDVSESEVRLYDAIYEGRMGSICERCSIIENIPIIKKPNASQLKETEKGEKVFSRMQRLSGVTEEKAQEVYYREDKLNELESKPELELPEHEKLNLIEHFHWEIMKERRRKGLSHEKLAESLGESVVVVQMIENGKLPENAESLIRKLEQFFQVKLRRVSEMQKYLQEQKKEPVLLDEQGHELEVVPEEEVEVIDIQEGTDRMETDVSLTSHPSPDSEDEIVLDSEDDEPKDMSGLDMEKGEFDITQADLKEINISHLRELNRKKVESTKRERVEEARKIEERERLVEARKEELRLMKEQETNELDNVLGGTELIGGNPEREKKVDEESFEEELI